MAYKAPKISEMTPSQQAFRRMCGRINAQEYRARNKYKNAYHCFTHWCRSTKYLPDDVIPSFKEYVRLRKLVPVDSVGKTYVGDVFSRKYVDDPIKHRILIDILKEMLRKHGPKKHRLIVDKIEEVYSDKILGLTRGVTTRLLAKIILGYL